jgi:hypothetical protein
VSENMIETKTNKSDLTNHSERLINNSGKFLFSIQKSDFVIRIIKNVHPIPTILFSICAILVIVSTMFPFWHMKLEAPQYPKGLNIYLFIDNVQGDIFEIEGLNHYIGMRSLAEAAPIERAISKYAMIFIAIFSALPIFLHTRWLIIFALPILLFPLIFLADLFYWLRLYGQNLDPRAALSSSVDPFTPPVIGTKKIANFVVINEVDIGFYIMCFTIVLFLIGFYYHQKIYKSMDDNSIEFNIKSFV